jgi:hypothetical protein
MSILYVLQEISFEHISDMNGLNKQNKLNCYTKLISALRLISLTDKILMPSARWKAITVVGQDSNH